MEKIISKRAHYTYFDHKKGNLDGWIDLLLPESYDWLNDSDIQKYVAKKWSNSGYKGGVLESVTFTHFE